CAWIAKQLGISESQVVRAMPNTPALIRKGVTGVYASSLLSAESKKQVEDILQSIGTVLWVDQEEQLDAVTALSGSGPAFVFYWLEGWLASAVGMGFTEAEARQLVLGTLDGALGLVQASPVSITELRRQVTSPGGTTAAALEHLEHQEWQKIFQQALERACHRARTLAQELEKSDKDN
ncbi:MAG: pyrroline-5-carboxylate reductase, partial [Ferrovum sp.]|nr:pyrroline-5-carboxylate reductase [Ferrovum sp.]